MPILLSFYFLHMNTFETLCSTFLFPVLIITLPPLFFLPFCFQNYNGPFLSLGFTLLLHKHKTHFFFFFSSLNWTIYPLVFFILKKTDVCGLEMTINVFAMKCDLTESWNVDKNEWPWISFDCLTNILELSVHFINPFFLRLENADVISPHFLHMGPG